MTTEFHNLVGQAGTYNSTGPKVDLDGAAKDDHVTFVTNVTSTSEVYVLIKKDATNLLVWEATFTDAATDTLTRVTELTSIGTISNTDAVDCYLINPAEHIKGNYEHVERFISGIEQRWDDVSTLTWSAGQAWVNGELLDFAGSTTGTIGQSSDGLSATGVWHHYLYNNSGTPTIELKQTAPVRNADDKYFQKTGDATRRWVGAHAVWTDTTRKIIEFTAKGDGNILTVEHPFTTPLRLQSGDPGTTMTTPATSNPNTVMPVTAFEIKLNTKLGSSTDNSDLNATVHPDKGIPNKSQSNITVRATFSVGSGTRYTFFGPIWMVLNEAAPQTFYIATAVNAGAIAAYLLDMAGWRAMR